MPIFYSKYNLTSHFKHLFFIGKLFSFKDNLKNTQDGSPVFTLLIALNAMMIILVYQREPKVFK